MRKTNKKNHFGGFVGYAMLLIGALLMFAVGVEYDPVMYQLRLSGKSTAGVITAKGMIPAENNPLPPLNSVDLRPDQFFFTVRFQTEVGEWTAAHTVPFSEQWKWDHQRRGDVIDLLYTNQAGRWVVACNDLVPLTPRSMIDLVLPAVFLFSGALLIIFDPGVLYFWK